jgi:hypothetical protein
MIVWVFLFGAVGGALDVKEGPPEHAAINTPGAEYPNELTTYPA